MAMTASIALSSATAKAGVNPGTTVTCTVSNSSGSAVNVLSIQPTAQQSGSAKRNTSVALGEPMTGPGSTVSVPASGNLAFSWAAEFYAPTNANMAASIAYDLGAVVQCGDGTIIYPAIATCTVSPPTITQDPGV